MPKRLCNVFHNRAGQPSERDTKIAILDLLHVEFYLDNLIKSFHQVLWDLELNIYLLDDLVRFKEDYSSSYKDFCTDYRVDIKKVSLLNDIETKPHSLFNQIFS
uniref:Uncharacterized protein n=1 Tax=Coccidioides posadasii RMSCC 3488 TaxID=454284 RepID=A0A0J6IFZ5_COCPO|nr:hypothetical protein CPAG_07033 [Coccidioides posadasii RMSCC 3488]